MIKQFATQVKGYLFPLFVVLFSFFSKEALADENLPYLLQDYYLDNRTLAKSGWSGEVLSPSYFMTPRSLPLAQTPESITPEIPAITPRYSADLTTGPGTGYGSTFGSIVGFIPLTQTPGQNLAYWEGKMNISTDEARLGGNFVFGYRTALYPEDLVLGGYIAYDVRGTDEGTFNQLGTGLEVLADSWEARFNAYFPIGETRRQIGERVADTGNIFSNLGFVGNLLGATRSRQQQFNRSFEAALTGFDLEGGIRLFNWETGELRAYLGTYFYDGPGTAGTLGGRGRLQAQINDNFQAGLSLQGDEKFGTNLTLNLGFSWGGSPARKKGETQQESILARLGLPPVRQSNIVVDQQLEVETISESEAVALINPATGQPWWFVHVTPGATGGDGTFELPFGEIAVDGVGDARSDGNNIIYVQAGASPILTGGFTIPDKVQLLSSAVSQFINTSQLGNLQLPGSGSGDKPIINNTVTMGNDTVISGFNIQPGMANNGIEGRNISNISIRDNDISNARDGMYLQNLTGEVTITNNTVDNVTSDGVEIDLNNNQLTAATISGNTISNPGDDGIDISALNGSGIGIATISGNTVNDTGGEGIDVDFIGSSTLTTANITGNTISFVGDEGIDVDFIGSSSSTTTNITGNTINYALQEGINLDVVASSSITTGNITGNTINYVVLEGIYVFANNSSITTTTISGNTVSNVGIPYMTYYDGIFVNAVNGSSLGTTTISGNEISYATQDGIDVSAYNGSQVTTTTISGNTINNVGTDGVVLYGVNNSSFNTADISNNNISNTYYDGIFVSIDNGSSLDTATISGNEISNVGEDGIDISTNNSSITTATISGNTINTPAKHGIAVYAINDYGTGTASITNATISGNTINNAVGNDYNHGIAVYAANYYGEGAITNATISGNTINNVGSNGIFLTAYYFYSPMYYYNGQIGNATITNNEVSNATQNSFSIVNGVNNMCVAQFTGNSSMTAGMYDLYSYTTGNLYFVNYATISGNNNNTINTIGGNMATTDVPACP